MVFVTVSRSVCAFFFFFNDTATTEIYTLSLHDALPICRSRRAVRRSRRARASAASPPRVAATRSPRGGDAALALARLRSEEHTSELQSRLQLVSRLLLEKKIMAVSLSACQQGQDRCV